jgi:dCMP deaminase
VITYKNRIISTGYVGSLLGEPHCLDEGCLIDPKTGGCIRTNHAEVNALHFIADGILRDMDEMSLYTTLSPCYNCARDIHIFGIPKVIYLVEYRKTEGIELLRSNGVYIEKYSGRIA